MTYATYKEVRTVNVPIDTLSELRDDKEYYLSKIEGHIGYGVNFKHSRVKVHARKVLPLISIAEHILDNFTFVRGKLVKGGSSKICARYATLEEYKSAKGLCSKRVVKLTFKGDLTPQCAITLQVNKPWWISGGVFTLQPPQTLVTADVVRTYATLHETLNMISKKNYAQRLEKLQRKLSGKTIDDVFDNKQNNLKDALKLVKK